MKKRQPFDVGWILFLAIIGILVYRSIEHHRILHRLQTMTPQHVVDFRIYPTGLPPVAEFQKFSVAEPLVVEFFQALSDTRSYYWATRDDISVAFVEVRTAHELFQVSLYLPHYKHGVLAGEIGKWGAQGASFFGSFQSRDLLQWYQKYEQDIEKIPSHPQETEELSIEEQGPP